MMLMGMWNSTGRRWTILGLCIGTLSIASAVPAVEPEAVSNSPFGVVCPWPGMDQAGVKWCRVGAGATAFCNWPDIQPSPDAWDWSRSDNELKNMLDPLGVSVLPILGYTPKWASRAPEDAAATAYPPQDLATFARFVHACVSRYKHRVRVWEIWNEPNIGFLNGSAADYAQMIKTAAVAAKRADPECRIAIGCAGVDIDYLQRLYEFGCGPFFDVMSVHPYQWGTQLNDGWMRERLEGCRALLDRHGDADKEIWITEQGWSLAEGVDAQQQANLLVQAMVTSLSVRERFKVEKYFWFCVKDWGSPGFGLLDVDGKPKPAFHAYRALTAELSQAHYCGTCEVPEGVRAHVFTQGDKPVVVLWNPAATGTIAVEMTASAGPLSLCGVNDEVHQLQPAQGKVTIEATHAPAFVRGMAMADLNVAAAPKRPAVPAVRRTPMSHDVWVSIIPPATTSRPFIALGGGAELPLNIHNDSSAPAQGRLQLELRYREQTLAEDELAFATASGKTQLVVWRPTLSAQNAMAGELAILHVRGMVGQTPLAPIDVPLRLASGRIIEFAANSWPEHQYLFKTDRSCTADGVRFGSEFGYRFDLGNAKSGQLRMNVGANGANAWSLLLSTDDRQYALECSGKSWPGWQTVALDKYLAAAGAGPAILYVKIQGIDCQVREVILQTDQHAGTTDR